MSKPLIAWYVVSPGEHVLFDSHARTLMDCRDQFVRAHRRPPKQLDWPGFETEGYRVQKFELVPIKRRRNETTTL